MIFRCKKHIFAWAIFAGLLSAGSGKSQASDPIAPITVNAPAQLQVNMTVPRAIRVVAPGSVKIVNGYGFADVSVKSNSRWSIYLTVIPSADRQPIRFRVGGGGWEAITSPRQLIMNDRPPSRDGSIRIEFKTDSQENGSLRIEVQGIV